MDSGNPKKACIKWGSHWLNLANTIEPSVCGGDAALTTCYLCYVYLVCLFDDLVYYLVFNYTLYFAVCCYECCVTYVHKSTK